MTFSKHTTSTSGNGGQYSSRGSGIDHFVVHHAATTSLSGVLSMMATGSRQVSANYVVKDAQIVGVVPEEFRSWSLSSSAWDGRSITVETCNSVAGDASGWPISEASHQSLARLIADCATRYGFPINRDRVIGHREVFSRHGASYATACPGSIDLDRLVTDALAIQQGTNAPMINAWEGEMHAIWIPEMKQDFLVTANGYRAISPETAKGVAAVTGQPIKTLNFASFWYTVVAINELNRHDSAFLGDDDVQRMAVTLGLSQA